MRSLVFTLILNCVLVGSAVGRDLPDYYPDDVLRRAGQLDAVYLDRDSIVIDDVPYQLSKDVVVHALTAYSVARTRLRPGTMVAFRVDGARTITAIWMLPRDFDGRERP